MFFPPVLCRRASDVFLVANYEQCSRFSRLLSRFVTRYSANWGILEQRIQKQKKNSFSTSLHVELKSEFQSRNYFTTKRTKIKTVQSVSEGGGAFYRVIRDWVKNSRFGAAVTPSPPLPFALPLTVFTVGNCHYLPNNSVSRTPWKP